MTQPWTVLTILLFLALLSPRGAAGEDPKKPLGSCLAPGPQNSAQRRACEVILEKGLVPESALARALEELRTLKMATALGPSTERWVSIGPAPMTGGTPDTTWTDRPRTGRMSAIAVDPADRTHWLVGAAGGGVWETRTSGTTWAPRTDDGPALAIGAIAFAPGNPKIVYAGTGEAVFSVDAYGGMGVLKSADGGQTWSHLTSTSGMFANKTFSDIAVDPGNPDIVVAAVTKPGLSWVPGATPVASGIYKSTNGGSGWNQTLPGQATDLEVHPVNFSLQYAALGNTGGAPENGVYRSINAGDNWNPVTGPWSTMAPGSVGRIELALAPSNPDVLYVSIHNVSTGFILGLWKTTTAWASAPTWQAIALGETDNGTGTFGFCGWNPFPIPRESKACYYNHVLSVDPANPDILYAGGISLWKYDGTHWHELAFHDPARGIHADQHRMAWAGSRLIVANDGGIWSTADGGGSWKPHNDGLATVQFWGGTIADTPSLFVLGGTMDNGTARWDASRGSWTAIVRGDAGPPAISRSSPYTHWGIAGIAQGLQIWRTVDAGRTLEEVQNGPQGLPTTVLNGSGITRPFAQCPRSHDVVVFGDFSLFKTVDFFSSRPNKPAWTNNSAAFATKLSAVSFAPSDPTCRTYAIATPGQVLLTIDGGVNWRNLDRAATLPQERVPRSLAFDPRTADTLYVAYTKFSSLPTDKGRVWRTANARDPSPVWGNVSPYVDFPHNSIAVDPTNPNVVWAGTDMGVWRGRWDSALNTMAWYHYGPETGLPNVAVSDVKVHPATRTPIAFTHGRGAFMLTTTSGWCSGAWLPFLGTNFGPCGP